MRGTTYLYNAHAIPAAGTTTTDPVKGFTDAAYLLMMAKFDYTSGGTTAKAYVQTSIDGGTTWIDIACFAFATSDETRLMKVLATDDLTDNTTPTDGSLTDDTTLSGVIGDLIRAKLVVVGTYASSTLTLAIEAK